MRRNDTHATTVHGGCLLATTVTWRASPRELRKLPEFRLGRRKKTLSMVNTVAVIAQRRSPCD